jgi:hypothetical protein
MGELKANLVGCQIDEGRKRVQEEEGGKEEEDAG